MRIAHRKNVLFRDHAWWDTAVNLASGCGGFCHSELVFDNGESFTSTTEYAPATLVYPSAHDSIHLARTNGPLLRRIKMPDWEWQFTELDLTREQESEVYRWAVETIDQSIKDQAGYDWRGVLRFVFKFLKQHPQDWFCSEIVVAALQPIIAGPEQDIKTRTLLLSLFKVRPWTISPNRLFDLCHP